jgi:hypothetical protein
MSDDHDDDDKTPTGRGPLAGFGGLVDAADIANTGIALATVATRFRHQADLADAAAQRCGEASRMGEDFSAKDRAAALADIEHDLITIADAVHNTIRAVRQARMAALKERH